MHESLLCSNCNKKWSRQKVRGRKPLLCPSCLTATEVSSSIVKPSKKLSPKKLSTPQPVDNPSSDVHELEKNISSEQKLTKGFVIQKCHPKPANYQELRESTKNGSVWKCSSCGHILKLDIGITDVPVHRCTPNMVSLKLYERIS